MTGAKVKIGFSKNKTFLYDICIEEPAQSLHEVEKTFTLLSPLGIAGKPDDLIVLPDALELDCAKNFIKEHIKYPDKPLIAVCISARIHKRWQQEKFIDLIQKISDERIADILLLWAPGPKDHPAFPGDDDLAHVMIKHFQDKIIAYPTKTLGSLICAIACSDLVLTTDAGSLHISAALKKTTLALMPKKNSQSWYPWRTRHTVITSNDAVKNIRVEDVYNSIKKMLSDSL